MRVNEVTIIFSSLIINPCHISRRGKFNNFGHETVDMHNGRAHCGEILEFHPFIKVNPLKILFQEL